jgi:redox-sensitive bicupin YhaK (pirin superfamily)
VQPGARQAVHGFGEAVGNARTQPLGMPWPTIDPFLFCVHHDDAYPRGNGQFGPAAPLAGRQLGQDFAGRDGWRMYHGMTVPGFPAHPHRGFETVTIVRRGLIDHSDSLGAAARFGGGDVQWLTAGRGIVHAEMFPLLDADAPNPLELFQIWLNLPASHKMADPHFKMLWSHEVPHHVARDAEGRTTEVACIAGRLAGVDDGSADAPAGLVGVAADGRPGDLDPAAGARRPLDAAGRRRAGHAPHAVLLRWRRLQRRRPGAARTGGRRTAGRAAVTLLHNPGRVAVELLLLQGRPIGEPVAQYGPFVMNTRAELQPGLRGLPAHAVRRLALARCRTGAWRHAGTLCAA